MLNQVMLKVMLLVYVKSLKQLVEINIVWKLTSMWHRMPIGESEKKSNVDVKPNYVKSWNENNLLKWITTWKSVVKITTC